MLDFSAIGEIPAEDANHWRYSNWTGVEWTKSMKDELYQFYNTNNPRPMVQSVCRGRSGVKYVNMFTYYIHAIVCIVILLSHRIPPLDQVTDPLPAGAMSSTKTTSIATG